MWRGVKDQNQLAFGEVGIDHGQGYAMETEVPGGIPGVLPFVRHRNHIGIVEVRPLVIATLQPFGRRWWLCRIAGQPDFHVVEVELLAP